METITLGGGGPEGRVASVVSERRGGGVTGEGVVLWDLAMLMMTMMMFE